MNFSRVYRGGILFFLVLDFLQGNPLPKSYSSTGDFSDFGLRLVSIFKIPIYRVLHRVLYRGCCPGILCIVKVSICLYGIHSVYRMYHM